MTAALIRSNNSVGVSHARRGRSEDWWCAVIFVRLVRFCGGRGETPSPVRTAGVTSTRSRHLSPASILHRRQGPLVIPPALAFQSKSTEISTFGSDVIRPAKFWRSGQASSPRRGLRDTSRARPRPAPPAHAGVEDRDGHESYHRGPCDSRSAASAGYRIAPSASHLLSSRRLVCHSYPSVTSDVNWRCAPGP